MSKLQNCGFISLLCSIGDKPLNLWSKHISPDGRVRRVIDEILNGDKVIEITGPRDISLCTKITCPADPMEILNIKLPILVMIIRNLQMYLKLEFQILDKKRYRRKFTFSTEETAPKVNIFTVQLPLKLEEDWNNLEINFQILCQNIFETDYEALQRIIIYSSCYIRRVYLQDRHYEHDETPVELCQAFFDMYMLKLGICFVDRSSQTEGVYTDLENNSSNPKSSHNVLKTKEKFRSCTQMNRDKIIAVTQNSKSVYELRQKENIEQSNTSIKSNDSSEENKIQETPSIYINEAYSPPKSLLGSPHLQKSKYLQMLGNPFFHKQYKESENMSHTPNKKIEAHILSLPAKESFLITDFNFSKRNMRNIKNIINEVQKEGQLDNNNDDFDSTDKFVIEVIPEFVELEAKLSENKCKRKFLTSDSLLDEFLKSRFKANNTIFQTLEKKGFTMPEVELSIYNSKNRKNCYGQGKLIESCRRSVNKATGDELKSLKTKVPFQNTRKITPKNEKLNGECCSLKPNIGPGKTLLPLEKPNKKILNLRSVSVNYLWKEIKDER